MANIKNTKIAELMNIADAMKSSAADTVDVKYRDKKISICKTANGDAAMFCDGGVIGVYGAGTKRFTWFGNIPLRMRNICKWNVRGKMSRDEFVGSAVKNAPKTKSPKKAKSKKAKPVENPNTTN